LAAWRSGAIRITFQANPRALHRPDDQRRGVELPAPQPVFRGAGEGVVVVVPGLAERGEGEPEDVGGVVVDLEATSRLGQLRDLFGESLDDPDARFELELALRWARLARSAGSPEP
jgi:hypothetical protein